MMFRTFTAQQTAKLIGIDRHLLPVLQEVGILQGIKTGRERRYREKDIEEFWDEYIGEDISNEQKIRVVALIHRTKKAI